MLEYDRLEAAYRRRTYYHNAHYSLDRGDGIEYEALFLSMSPCEIYERKVTMEQLHAAMATLPDKQAKRIYARYFLGLETQVIAWSEESGHEAAHGWRRRCPHRQHPGASAGKPVFLMPNTTNLIRSRLGGSALLA